MARIDAFLKLGLAQGCSDVHLAVGVPPMLRMNGDLMPIKFRELSDAELETYLSISPMWVKKAGAFVSTSSGKRRGLVRYSALFPATYRNSNS